MITSDEKGGFPLPPFKHVGQVVTYNTNVFSTCKLVYGSCFAFVRSDENFDLYVLIHSKPSEDV